MVGDGKGRLETRDCSAMAMRNSMAVGVAVGVCVPSRYPCAGEGQGIVTARGNEKLVKAVRSVWLDLGSKPWIVCTLGSSMLSWAAGLLGKNGPPGTIGGGTPSGTEGLKKSASCLESSHGESSPSGFRAKVPPPPR